MHVTTSAGAHGSGAMLRKANDCERPIASERRETAARAPEIPAGHGPAVPPTSRDSGRFPGRLAVRRAAWLQTQTRSRLRSLLAANEHHLQPRLLHRVIRIRGSAGQPALDLLQAD